ncbi:MAG: hypothetical protein M5U01_13120 [Ardenticatenaceae bacterium]|nr:hypothetical protein [Ardenticatenaceae bacterium]HBY96424.1 hypothetical protein [Chloroflexota bacterium]
MNFPPAGVGGGSRTPTDDLHGAPIANRTHDGAEIQAGTILDGTNRGTVKLIAPAVPKEQPVKEIITIKVKQDARSDRD